MQMSFFRKIVILTVLVCLFTGLPSCYASRMKEHYANKENYVNVTGIVTKISYDHKLKGLYINFKDLVPECGDYCFKIVGDNLTIVLEKDITQKIQQGDEVNFVTAPEIFGDGYIMPIVAISVNGEELLDFETGYANLLKWLDEN